MHTKFLLTVIASGSGGGGLMDVNPGLMIWTVITFIVLLFILKKYAWKPILTALDKRENDIKESLAQAEQAKIDAKKIVDEASLEIQRKKDAAFEELRAQIAEIAVSAAEKIIRESLDAQKSKQVIDKYLNDVAKN